MGENDFERVRMVEADRDRRYLDRVKVRPTDPAGFREGWDVNGLDRGWNDSHPTSLARDDVGDR